MCVRIVPHLPGSQYTVTSLPLWTRIFPWQLLSCSPRGILSGGIMGHLDNRQHIFKMFFTIDNNYHLPLSWAYLPGGNKNWGAQKFELLRRSRYRPFLIRGFPFCLECCSSASSSASLWLVTEGKLEQFVHTHEIFCSKNKSLAEHLNSARLYSGRRLT